METVVGVERNNDECGVENCGSSPSSPKLIADPVVYKLVRVDGDGRLVPATDEEVMEVVDLLEVDESKMEIATGSGKVTNEEISSGKTQLDILRLPQSEVREADPAKLNVQVEETVPVLKPTSDGSGIDHSKTIGECLCPSDNPSGLSSSSVCTSLMPDFSKIKGEICLDKLSIRELHETFRATFGRETTIKDKLWLKRRIAMGLTNSCYIPATAFTIRDGKLVTESNEENCTKAGSVIEEEVVRDVNKIPQTSHGSQMEDHQNSVGGNFRDSLENNCRSDGAERELQTAKRMRKPTKRYIEELSELESRGHNGISMTASRKSSLGQKIPFSKHVKKISLDGRTFTTRLDSLGGSGVQIPCVSRVRKSRPRKNISDLKILNTIGMDVMVQSLHCTQEGNVSAQGDGNGHKIQEFSYSSDNIQKMASCHPAHSPVESENGTHYQAVEAEDLGKASDTKSLASLKGASDDNIMTIPTSKGGIRRKHHRAWTLSEVMRLIEGVSRYGAGRWSEIKRVAFASYSYRTSVDLKDKWRNLLKASSAKTQLDQVATSRKHSSLSIPSPILSQVRELAARHAQVPANLSSRKLIDIEERVVVKARSG